MRRALCVAWNKGQVRFNKIDMPDELVPQGTSISTTDYTEWDSEDEDNIDLKSTIESKKVSTVTLTRSNGEIIKNVTVLDMKDVVKIGRQIVKRSLYKEHLPLVAKVGANFFEYKDPGTLDIYATPLVSTGKDGEYKRKGKSDEFNFKNLTHGLEEQLRMKNKISTEEKIETDEKMKEENVDTRGEMMKNVFGTFLGDEIGLVSEAEEEAIAAISCDFMKGSKAFEFVRDAKEKSEKEKTSFSGMFTGDDPVYEPAKEHGRRLVTERTNKRRLENKKEGTGKKSETEKEILKKE
jgi:hypothetical protein